MQHIVKMSREAKALHTRPNRPTSWVHLDHWAIAWMGRKEKVIIQRAEKRLSLEREHKLCIENNLVKYKNTTEKFTGLTYLPFCPWRLPARGQHKSQTPKLYCQRGCFPESTSGQVCHTAGGCITWKTYTYIQLFLLYKKTSFTRPANPSADSPDLPWFPAMVHHSQDATGWF